jgi:hypothetical protein
MQYQLTHSCLVMVLLCLIYVSYVFGLGGINMTKPTCFNKQRIVCVCVCDCVLCVGMHYKIKFDYTWNYYNIMLNVSAFISPIRLRNITRDLAGERVRVCGWGKTSDSKYSFLIILRFKLNNFTYQNGCFKGEGNHGLQNFFYYC